jgi:hypothetical protein
MQAEIDDTFIVEDDSFFKSITGTRSEDQDSFMYCDAVTIFNRSLRADAMGAIRCFSLIKDASSKIG